jgi:hypothetical protein
MIVEMKQLFFFVILLAVLGVAGFLYRATLEGPTHATNMDATACPLDAKVCPDGSSVGRSGPSCQFAACALPNVEVPEAGIAFALPAGYRADENAYGADTSLLGAFIKDSLVGTSTQPDTIIVKRYSIEEGGNANAVMLEHTTYQESGEQPSSMDAFTPVIVNGRTYQMITIERFEGVVDVLYYLPRDTDVIRFEVVQHSVSNWTDPGLGIRSLPAVSALESLLATIQVR